MNINYSHIWHLLHRIVNNKMSARRVHKQAWRDTPTHVRRDVTRERWEWGFRHVRTFSQARLLLPYDANISSERNPKPCQTKRSQTCDWRSVRLSLAVRVISATLIGGHCGWTQKSQLCKCNCGATSLRVGRRRPLFASRQDGYRRAQVG